MSQSVAFPPELTERLKDEAHFDLCRQALRNELQSVQSRTEEVAATRPPFGFLSSKQTRTVFAENLDQVRRTEQEVQEKVLRLDRMESVFREAVREQLHRYLAAASADYRELDALPNLKLRWERTVNHLADLMQGFARDLKNLLAVYNVLPAGAPPLLALRETVVAIAHTKEDCDDLADAIAQHVKAKLGRELRMPSVAGTVDLVWFDPLVRSGLPAATKALRQAEDAARQFVQSGKSALLAGAPNLEADCAAAKENYLAQYWAQLRQHTLQHLVGGAGATRSLDELEQRFAVLRWQREQQVASRSPFALGV